MSHQDEVTALEVETKRYAIERLLEHLSAEDFERLKGLMRAHQRPLRAAAVPVPPDAREETSVYLVHVLIEAVFQFRRDFGESEHENLRTMWHTTANDYAEMVANDLRLMWAEGKVHQPAFYGFASD